MRRTSPAHDEQWFEDLFRRHHAAVRTYAARRSPSEADDVVAEVFAVAWRKRDQVPESALPWLYAVAAREVLHTLRAGSMRGDLHARLATRVDLVTPDESSAVVDRVSAAGPVHAALARLAAADAEVLRLWAWEQLEPQEIAIVLDISAVAARVRLHRARKRFEAALAAVSRRPPVTSSQPIPIQSTT